MKLLQNKIRKLLSIAICGAMLAGMSNAVSITINAETGKANFARALQYSIYFYDANMCGTDVSENNRYSWRGNCHTYDAMVEMNSTATNLSETFLEKYHDILDRNISFSKNAGKKDIPWNCGYCVIFWP